MADILAKQQILITIKASPPPPILSHKPIVIVVTNKSSCLTNADATIMVAALNLELPGFCAAWGLGPATAVLQPQPPPSLSELVIDDCTHDRRAICGAVCEDVKANLAATITDDGGDVPLFRDATTATIAQCLSHNVYAMLGDIHANVWVEQTDGQLIARETTSPVQDDLVVVLVDGQPVGLSSYVLPAWFDPMNTQGPFDRLTRLKAPFSMTDGGFLIKMLPSRSYKTIGAAMPAFRRALYTSEASARIRARNPTGVELGYGSTPVLASSSLPLPLKRPRSMDPASSPELDIELEPFAAVAATKMAMDDCCAEAQTDETVAVAPPSASFLG